MRRIEVACVGALALAITGGWAAAADIPPRYPAGYSNPTYFSPPIVAPYDNWSGFYLGINGGGAWGRSQWDTADRFDISGGLIGGTVGFNWLLGPAVVVGIEGDLDWSGIKGSTTTLCPLGCETRNHWLATVRGRAGIGYGPVLPYLTGGLAAGDIQASTPGFPGGSITAAGWTFGGGIEFRMLSRASVKAEYLHVDLGDFNCGLNCGLPPGGNVSFHANVLRAGLNVRF